MRAYNWIRHINNPTYARAEVWGGEAGGSDCFQELRAEPTSPVTVKGNPVHRSPVAWENFCVELIRAFSCYSPLIILRCGQLGNVPAAASFVALSAAGAGRPAHSRQAWDGKQDREILC
jgi:hypothetical protein